MKYIQELDHQWERVQKTPKTGASYKSHHVDVLEEEVVVMLGWAEARTHVPLGLRVGVRALC